MSSYFIASSVGALMLAFLACGSTEQQANASPARERGGTPTTQASAAGTAPNANPGYLAARNSLTREESSFDSSRVEQVELPDGRTVRMESVVPVDAIPAIFDPAFVSAEAADATYKPDERVLGISLDGDARAYSIPLMSRHEIVNDTVGGRKVAVTW